MLRKALPWLLLGFAATTPASGQSDKPLRAMLSDLFTFGTCGEPLCLDGSINAENGHGDHYLPAVATGNLALISFIEDAIGKSVSATPLSATSSNRAGMLDAFQVTLVCGAFSVLTGPPGCRIS